MKPHDGQESSAAEIAEFLGTVNEVVDLAITDDEVETRLQRHIRKEPIDWFFNVTPLRSAPGVLVSAAALGARRMSLRLRIWLDVRVVSVSEWDDQREVDITGRAVMVDPGTVDYPAGREDVPLHQFFVMFEMPSDVGDDPVAIGTVCAVADGSESEEWPVLLKVTTGRPGRWRRAMLPSTTRVNPTMRMLSDPFGSGDAGSGSWPGDPGLAAFGGDLTIQNSSDGNRP